MVSKLSSRFVGALVFGLACSASASADTLIGKDTIKYGKITRIDNTAVHMAEGCDQGKVKSFPLEDVRVIKFNADCNLPEKIPSTSGLNSNDCPDEPNQIVYVVSFGREGRVYATQISFDGADRLKIDAMNGVGTLNGPVGKVRLISRISTCRKYIPEKFRWPKEYSKT